ncbi:MAG: cupin domain-containing protein [Actinomycetota bacterium]|nr:cupin domain-containing protein [Actinomycetota bacterium]
MSDYTVRRIGDMDTFYKGLLLRARAELGVQSFGLAVIDLERGADDHPEHDHAQAGQEEVFVVLRGTGTMEVDGDTVDLDPETIVRVGPGAKRRIAPGTGGIRLLAIGGVPNQAYQAPAYTDVGAPDPLAP